MAHRSSGSAGSPRNSARAPIRPCPESHTHSIRLPYADHTRKIPQFQAPAPVAPASRRSRARRWTPPRRTANRSRAARPAIRAREPWRRDPDGQPERHPLHLPRLLREGRPPGGAELAAGAAQRPDADVHQLRHGAVQEPLHRPRAPRLRPRHHQPEVRARRRQAQRPRQRRLHRAAPHLLRDARQLLVRRLLQGTRHPARLGAADPRLRPAEGQAPRHRLPRRRRGGRALAQGRRACPTTASSASPPRTTSG